MRGVSTIDTRLLQLAHVLRAARRRAIQLEQHDVLQGTPWTKQSRRHSKIGVCGGALLLALVRRVQVGIINLSEAESR